MNVQTYSRLGDKVEDRSLSTGTGYIVYLRGNEIGIRYSDGSEETVDADLLIAYDVRHWII